MPVISFNGVGYDSNMFLITGSDPILVDTGTGMHIRKFLERLKNIEGSPEPTRIILTHRHFDHIGGACELASHFKASVWMHDLDAESVEKGDGKSTAANMFGAQLRPIEVNRLRDGDAISTGEHRLTIIHTPGHTIGSMCLYEEDSGILISGDTVFVGGVGRWDLPTGSREDLEKSVKILLSKKPKHLYPGHGDSAIGTAMDAIKDAAMMLGEF